MKPHDARLILILVSGAAVWMDAAAFSHWGFWFMLLTLAQCVMIWSLLKLRRVSADEFYQEDVFAFMAFTIGLDAIYVISIFMNPTFSSAFVLMIRSAQFVFIVNLLPLEHHTRPPYAHWLNGNGPSEYTPEKTIQSEIYNIFSFESRVGCEPDKV